MSWLTQSDVSANHPLVLRVLEMDIADDRLLNEMYGWVNRCATQSAAFDQDYIVEVGTAKQMAGLSRYVELLAAAKYCGLFAEKEIEENGSMRRVLKLVEEADLFHMILKSEKERERNRLADNRKPERAGPVRMRDGDECRWCGRVVTFGPDRKSARVGTIDHLDPRDLDLDEPTPLDRLVVACIGCNSARKDGANWDRPLKSAPREPYYSKRTADWLFDRCGYRVKVSEERKELSTPEPDESPVFEGSTSDMPDWAKSDSDDATATSGASSIDSNTTAAGTVETHVATAPPATSKPRSHSDLLAFPNVPETEDVAPAVETPAPGETPANDEATDTSGPSGARSTDQREIRNGSIDHQLKIKDDEGIRSGFAGSGRDGSGRVGSGRAGSRAPEPASKPVPSNVPKPRSRRRRPRRR